jgi:hypothetical protein
MFPYPHHVVPLPPQLASNASIAKPIRPQLITPKLSARPRDRPVALRTTVPKTPVDKNGEALPAEVEIRAPRDICDMLGPAHDAFSA